MTVLPSIEQELRELAYHQEIANLAVVLRRRLHTITCGELGEVLASDLGRRIAAMKITDLLGIAAPPDPQEDREGSPKSAPATDPAGSTGVGEHGAGRAPVGAVRDPTGTGAAIPADPAKRTSSATAMLPAAPPERPPLPPTPRELPATTAARIDQDRWATPDTKRSAKAMLSALAEIAGPTTSRELRKALDIDEENGRRGLGLLLSLRLIERIGDGPRYTYRVAGDGATRPKQPTELPKIAEPPLDEAPSQPLAAATSLATAPSTPSEEERIAGYRWASAAVKDLAKLLLGVLRQHGEPISTGELTQAISVPYSRLRDARELLLAVGLIGSRGKRPQLLYAFATGDDPPASPTGDPAAAEIPVSDASTKYDEAILRALREVGGQVSSTTLLSHVGGSILSLRRSLRRLVASGQVLRTGQGPQSLYAIAGPAEGRPGASPEA